MERKPLLMAGLAVAGVAVAVAVGAGTLTYAMSGTESTVGLDTYDTVTVNGQRALSGDIVAGRTTSKYHPLPWVGTRVKDVQCPGLQATAGARATCTARTSSGNRVSIPVTVVKADASSVTWKFER